MKYQSTKLEHNKVIQAWRRLSSHLWRWEMREAPVISSNAMVLDAIASPDMQEFLRRVRKEADISIMTGNRSTKIYLNHEEVVLTITDDDYLPLPLHPELQYNAAGEALWGYVEHSAKADDTVNYLRETFMTCIHSAIDYEHLRLMLTTSPLVLDMADHGFPARARDPATFKSALSGVVSFNLRKRIDHFDGYFLNLTLAHTGGVFEVEGMVSAKYVSVIGNTT